MKTRVLFLLLLPMLYVMQSCDDPKNANKYDNETTVDVMGLNFISNAEEAGHTEIAAAKVAVNNSKNQQVVDFAKMMIADHTAAGEKLNGLKDWALVRGHFPVNEEHQELIDTLAKLSADDFDKAYMKFMVASHQEAVSLFEGGSDNRANKVQSFAKEIKPTVEKHLESAKNILASLK
jgi:putative membrane protein